jgi:hypothetical protein
LGVIAENQQNCDAPEAVDVATMYHAEISAGAWVGI